MIAAELARVIQGGAKRRGEWYDAHCPAHEDLKASLSFKDGTDLIVFTCHKGCPSKSIAEAMAAQLGVRVSDFFFGERTVGDHNTDRTGRQSRIVAEYDFEDENGTLLLQEVGVEPKAFFVRRPDGQGGWIKDSKGVPKGILYRRKDIQGLRVVALTEGPKDANTLWEHGVPATTNAFGAGKWTTAHTENLVRAGVEEVLVFRDNDRAGAKHAAQVADSCLKAGLVVKLINLPELPPLREKGGEDVSDWLTGRTREDLEAAINAANPLTESDLNISAQALSDRQTSASSSPDTSTAVAGNPWVAAQPVSDFLKTPELETPWLDQPLLAFGSITEMFSPRGIGKTHIAHAKAVDLARKGKRVLLLDRDNSPRETKRRLRNWGADRLTTLKVLTRNQAPPLTDAAAWAQFPVGDYDLLIVDSLDATTEGIGEKDSAKPSKAIAPILDLAHQPNGPAVLVLGNVVKSGQHGRGSGVIEDRADICYEVRDATGFEPTGTVDWWLELPPCGAEAWGQRASRRKRRDIYRLAFVPTKLRIAEEPDPFVLELDMTSKLWSLRDVTSQITEAAKVALVRGEQEMRKRLEDATMALREEIHRRANAGEEPMLKDKEAEPFLMNLALKRREARRLIESGGNGAWKLEKLKGRKGTPVALVLADGNPGQSQDAAAEKGQSQSPESRTPWGDGIPADRMNTGRRESDLCEPAPAAEIRDEALFPPPVFDGAVHAVVEDGLQGGDRLEDMDL